MFNEAASILLPIARASIAKAIGCAPAATQDAAWLQEMGACFVTLTQAGQLRGCMGSLLPYRSLIADVQGNAVAAALHDPRFEPLVASELDSSEIEISLLSAMQPLTFSSEADALAQLRPGVDGVVLELGRYRSTFLPQVWGQLPTARDFMAQLKRKARLPTDFWSSGLKLQRYTVSKWKDSDLQPTVSLAFESTQR